MQISVGVSLLVRMILVIAVAFVFLGSGCVIERNERRADRIEEAALTESVFGLWVTRWDYQTPDDIREIVSKAASLGITDLYWQVRGQADAYYQSEIEPWGEELTRLRGQKNENDQARIRLPDPGFDPLELAIEQAHAQGIRLHAWINVMPLWRGISPPIDEFHLFHRRPEWRLTDETGTVQPLGTGYVVVNPVLDEVQDHIVNVVRDIVTRYDIDGVHLDYIRFLTDELGKEKLYPGDAKSLSLYARMVGDRATVGHLNRTKYRAWIRDRITTLVDRIGREALDGYPQIRYSAAVWRRPDLARDQYLQDAQRWVNEGMVDEIMPMIYTDKDIQFEDDLKAWYAAVDHKRVLAGIGVYKHDSAGQTLSQATLGHPRRFVLFAYSSMFESANPDQDKTPEAIRLRAMQREAMTKFIERLDQFAQMNRIGG